MQNQNNQENTSFNDQSKSDQALKDEVVNHDAEMEVRENEDASLQDKEYSFDEDLTGTEEYHDVDDFGDDAITGARH
jgi:hypothetical protein